MGNAREYARLVGSPTIGPGGMKCPCCFALGDRLRQRRSYRRASRVETKRELARLLGESQRRE